MVSVRRLLSLTALLLAGCSSGAISEEGTTIVQSSTSLTQQTLPGEDITYTAVEYAFFDDVEYYYGFVSETYKPTALETGYLLCTLMDEGMTDVDIVERINEAGTDLSDRQLQFSIAIASSTTLCQKHSKQAEYIALNYPIS
jgi:hypothetical protein